MVELARSPVRSPPSPVTLNGGAGGGGGEVATVGGGDDDVFLFDNNIPSIATRIPTSAEPADTLALRRRNRLLRLVSESRVCGRRGGGHLQRSASVQLDDRRPRCPGGGGDRLSQSLQAAGGGYLLTRRHLAPPPPPDDGDQADVQDGQLRQSVSVSRGGRGDRRPSLTNGSWSDPLSGSDASTLKRRGTLTAAKMQNAVDDDLDHDDDDDDDNNASHVCNGLDDQTKNACRPSECSQNAN